MSMLHSFHMQLPQLDFHKELYISKLMSP